MSRQFSIPTLLRMTPNVMLAKFFGLLGLDSLGIDWDHIGERQIEPIIEKLYGLPAEQLDGVESAMRSVFDLASVSGVDALLQAADESDEARILGMIPETAGYYAIAMWNWLACPKVFETAQRINKVRTLSWWRKRNDVPRVAPDLSDQALRRLEQAISLVLVREQGRGKHCTIETMSRDCIDYVFVHPDDFVQLVTIHDSDGTLDSGTIRPTLQLVFAYRRDEGSLEIFAKLPAKIKRMLEEAFVRCTLQSDLGDWQVEPAYHLDHLKDSRFVLETDPWDRVEAHIRRIRLEVRRTRRKIWVEVDSENQYDNLHRALAECLDEEHVPLADTSVTRVALTFDFLPHDGRKSGRVTFEVGVPDSCTVRSELPERVALIHKYLKRWGIDCVQLAEASLVSA